MLFYYFNYHAMELAFTVTFKLLINSADSCTGARKYPDCCKRVNASACYVPGGNCYCDPLCTQYRDCCNDAETRLTQCKLLLCLH